MPMSWVAGAAAVVGLVNGINAMTSPGGALGSDPNAPAGATQGAAATGGADAGVIATNATAIQNAMPGIDTSTAQNFAAAGYTAADVQTMASNGASMTDINTIGTNLNGLAAGQSPASLGLGQAAQQFLSGPVGQSLIGAAFTTAGTQYATNAARQAGGILASGAQQAANIQSTAALGAARTQAGAATATGQTLAGGATTAAGQTIAGEQAAIGTAQQTLAQQQAIQQPYQTAGTQALQTLSAGLAPGGQFNRPFTMADAQNMPAYQFALEQGQQAISNAAAAGGTQLSSANIESLGKFASGTAAQYEQQAFNQWLQQNNLSLGALQNMVATGQISTGQLQTSLQNAGVSMQTAQKAIGAAQATGTLGAAQATAAAQTAAANATAQGMTGSAAAQAAGVQGVAGYNAAALQNAANLNLQGMQQIGQQSQTLIPAAVGSTLSSLGQIGSKIGNYFSTPSSSAAPTTMSAADFMSVGSGTNAPVNLGNTTPMAASPTTVSDPYAMAASGQTVNLANTSLPTTTPTDPYAMTVSPTTTDPYAVTVP